LSRTADTGIVHT